MFKDLSAKALAAQAESEALLAHGGVRPGSDQPLEPLDPSRPDPLPTPEDGRRQDDVDNEDPHGPAR